MDIVVLRRLDNVQETGIPLVDVHCIGEVLGADKWHLPEGVPDVSVHLHREIVSHDFWANDR